MIYIVCCCYVGLNNLLVVYEDKIVYVLCVFFFVFGFDFELIIFSG